MFNLWGMTSLDEKMYMFGDSRGSNKRTGTSGLTAVRRQHSDMRRLQIFRQFSARYKGAQNLKKKKKLSSQAREAALTQEPIRQRQHKYWPLGSGIGPTRNRIHRQKSI